MKTHKIRKPLNDNEFLEHVAKIIFVAGFRYSIVADRWPKMKKAFHNFSVKKLASLNEKDIDKLMEADGMIRNRMKITAIIENAKICKELQKLNGTVLKWIEKKKKAYNNDPLFNESLFEVFQHFKRIGKITAEWLAKLHNAKGEYHTYKM